MYQTSPDRGGVWNEFIPPFGGGGGGGDLYNLNN